jgi:hypothetical protein
MCLLYGLSPSISYKYQTREEVTASDKHSSLLRLKRIMVQSPLGKPYKTFLVSFTLDSKKKSL